MSTHTPKPGAKLRATLLAAKIPDDIAELAVKAVLKATRPGRYEPETTHGKMMGARRARARFVAERNELIRVLAKQFYTHLMPVSGHLEPLSNRRTVCVHGPEQLCWVIDKLELDQFAGMDEITESHWDGHTKAERSARLTRLTFDAPTKKTTRRTKVVGEGVPKSVFGEIRDAYAKRKAGKRALDTALERALDAPVSTKMPTGGIS
jgi:hypothetical protein